MEQIGGGGMSIKLTTMKILILLLISIACFGQAETSSDNYVPKYTQTTDGSNDYYVGIDATNGFSVTAFQNVGNIVINVLINFSSSIEAADAVTRFYEMSNTARTSLYGPSFGNMTGLLTNEYVGHFHNNAGTIRGKGVTQSSGSISTGWHMITLTVESGVGSKIYIDGVENTNTAVTASGDVITVSTAYTCDRIALFATTAGGAPHGCTWREFAIVNIVPTGTDVLNLYKFYTKQGNITLANSRRSASKFLPYRASILALYKGNESGSDLLDYKDTAHDLTKTNF